MYIILLALLENIWLHNLLFTVDIILHCLYSYVSNAGKLFNGAFL